MAATPEQKQGNMVVLRGGQPRTTRGSGRPRTSLQRALDLAVAEEFAAMRGEDGRVPGRPFYNIAELMAFPLRVLARRVIDGRRARVPRERFTMIGVKYLAFVDRVYDEMRTGEWDLVA